jgi:polar amino acid transport system substrate-binding protein
VPVPPSTPAPTGADEENPHTMPAVPRPVAALALLAAAGLALTGCTSTAEGADSATADGLTVCTNSPYPPFELERDGTIVGFDMDLADEIAADLGVGKTVVQANFETLESGAALDTAQCDVAIAGITVTDERASVMDFSEPYFNDELALLTARDSGVDGFAGLGGAAVGVQQGTSGEDHATDQGWDVQQYEDVELMFQALETEGVDAVVGNVSALGERAAASSDLELVETLDNGEELAVAVRKGNTELLAQVNSTLERIQGDGTLERMRADWMGL